MALVPCSACKRRSLGRLISIYTARFSESRRVAYKTRLCYECAAEYADTLKAAHPVRQDVAGAEWPDTCSMCGSGSALDLDPIYLTIYEPKQDGRALAVPSCAACTANLAPLLEKFGERLEDRTPVAAREVPNRPATGEGAPSPLAWA